MTITSSAIVFKELQFEVDILMYSPERPAPACSNHDSPRYSDPGSDEELEFMLFVKNQDGDLIEIKDDILYNVLYEDVLEEARSLYEDGKLMSIHGRIK